MALILKNQINRRLQPTALNTKNYNHGKIKNLLRKRQSTCF